MTYSEIQVVEVKFNAIVNNNVTERYEYEMADRNLNPSDDFHFFIKVRSIIWNNEWQIMMGFANLIHRCIRYNVRDGEFEIW